MRIKTKNIISRKTITNATLVVIVLVALGWGLLKIVQRVTYNERRELLKLSTATAASIIDQENKTQWKIADMIRLEVMQSCDRCDCLEDALALVYKQFERSKDFFYVIDKSGQYYCGDGTHGRLTNATRYSSDAPDSLDFVGSLPHLKIGSSYRIFSTRLAQPIHVKTKQGWKDIIYIDYAQDVNEIMTVLGTLYPGEINAFVTDVNGVMVYKYFGIDLLLEGANCITKLSQCRYPFGEDPDELIRKFRAFEPFVAMIDIGGKNYYFCVSPLQSAKMSLAYVVQADNISNLSNFHVNVIYVYVSIIILVLGFFIFSRMYMSLKRKVAVQRLKEQTRVAEAMTMASKAKSEFLSSMSHDIRTPINGIMGVTTLALHASKDPTVTDYLHKIDATSHHLLSLINDVLDMSRIESGKTTITPVAADIRNIAENCHTIINGQLLDRKLDFELDFKGIHTAVMADVLHLQQVFINLLGNSVKFTEDGGHIWFRCHEKECENGRVAYCFEVEDTGRGMSPEFLGHIFEAFSQEGDAARTQYKGTGLGMAITKRLVDLMDGTIVVESELGKGSRFSIDMAFDVNENAVKEDESPSDSPNLTSLDGIRILLVDDNDLNREIATELLSMEGAIVETAEDGVDAVEKYKASVNADANARYDVILMDVMMPRMNGYEATKQIREYEKSGITTHVVPIIAMTANAFDDDIKATKDAGMDAHLSKPIDMTKVISTISIYVKRQ